MKSLIVTFVLLATSAAVVVADDETTITETEKPMRHSFGDAGKEQYSISQTSVGDFTKNYWAEDDIPATHTDCANNPDRKNKSTIDHRITVGTNEQLERESLKYQYEPVTGNQRIGGKVHLSSKYLKPSKSEDIKIKLGKHKQEECP